MAQKGTPLSGDQLPPGGDRFFTVLIHYLRPIPEMGQVGPKHRAYLGEIFNKGFLVASGPLVPRTGGILWMRANSREEIERIVEGDPYAQAKIATFQILEFDPKTLLPALHP
uniref:YCII-related domain-containing protein n=1 Tax=Leptospirillum ferriphilum TaxID=178606 RepID=A0A7C3R0F8_9BACT